MWLVISLTTLHSLLKMAAQYISWLRVPNTLAYQSPKECFEKTGDIFYYEVEYDGTKYYIPSPIDRPISITETEVVRPKMYEG